MMAIRNIYCVGRNYADHALELGNKVPDAPIIFQKPTHAIAKADGRVLTFPGDKGEIHHELELVLYVGKSVVGTSDVMDAVTKMALGIDFTLRDIQTGLKKKGYPWLLAKGFRNSAVLTDFWDFPGTDACREKSFSLYVNDELVQKGNISSMIFDFKTVVEYINEHFGLSQGDIIYTGTPEGVGRIHDEHRFVLHWGKEEKGSFIVDL